MDVWEMVGELLPGERAKVEDKGREERAKNL